MVLSYLTYYVWKPQQRMNYGELLDLRKTPPADFVGLDGARLKTGELSGKWLLVLFDQSSCKIDCQQRLYSMRQSRLAMREKRDKVATLWLVTDAGQPADMVLQQFREVGMARAGAEYEGMFPSPAMGRIFLLDPKGNQVLRYPENPEPAKMIRDLARLLDVKRM